MSKLKILTEDHYQLSVTTFFPQKPIHHTIIISAATGVKQQYYRHFADYLSQHGFHVYTYDYRGIGESRQGPLKKMKVSFQHWGELDLTALIHYAQREHPGSKLTVMGHSIGGQLIGLSSAAPRIDNVVLIASQTPYWKHYRGFMRFKVWQLWHIMIPVFTKLFGYFPAKKFGLFEDLPGEAALQWARWGKNKNYMFDEFPKKKENFEMLSKPALVFSFSDDSFAPADAVKDLLHYYSNLEIEHHHLEPSDIGRKQIGHFNFFRKEFRDPFWSTVSQWLLERTIFGKEIPHNPSRKAVKQPPHSLHVNRLKVS